MHASLWWGWVENLCVRFSSHHMKRKRYNCWEWPGPTRGKRAFFSNYMFDGWLCRYWPSYLHCQHAPCDSYKLPQPPALTHSQVHHNNCLLWVDCECLSGCICLSLLSLHTKVVKSTLVLTRMSPCFNLSVLGSRSLGMPFLCSLTVPQQEIFLGWVVEQVRGGKEAVHVQFMALVRLVIVSWVAVRCCATLCLPSLRQTFMSHVYPVELHSLNILMQKCLRFFTIYCLKTTFPLNFTLTSSIRKGCKIPNCSSLEC